MLLLCVSKLKFFSLQNSPINGYKTMIEFSTFQARRREEKARDARRKTEKVKPFVLLYSFPHP